MGAPSNSTLRPQEVPVPRQSPRRLISLLGEQRIEDAEARALSLRDRLRDRVVWNINSTARGGGVAEMLQALLPYARGMGVDARWLAIQGTPDFFHITKRLHHALHGSAGDGSLLDQHSREVYESVLRGNADHLVTTVRPGDIVILHDPQTAGLIGPLKRHGAHVVWRCHVGSESRGPEVDAAWDFLQPYVTEAEVNIFSRASYIPDCCDGGRSVVIQPSIDPFSPKNAEMDPELARTILTGVGIIEGPSPEAVPTFTRLDGSPGRIDHLADVTSLGPSPPWDAPLIVQVSRWDPLKDPVGVIDGFVEYLHGADGEHPHLLLAGPTVRSIPDDPESVETLDATLEHWRRLPHAIRSRIHLACLPMADVEENGAIVNALQRHAAIVVQKSTHEGFGLTVTEAMWKARPIIASAVGGIVEQVQDGINGLLLSDPADPAEFAAAIRRLLGDPALGQRLGDNARETVREHYLPIRHLTQYADLFERLDI
jgi:trehalose synthase